jgi:predicted MPP superfamily phosphohydrolase
MRGSLPTFPSRAPVELTRRDFIAGFIACTSTLSVYANDFSRHDLEIAERTFHLRNLPPAFDGFRIVQFSDIHLEQFTEDFFLREVIRRVNALNADLLLITGDYISRGPRSIDFSFAAAGHCAALLSTLTCPLRFGILGNHDAWVGSRIIRDHMENNGLPLLVNQFLRIERNGEHIFLAGLDDCFSGFPNLSLALPAKPDAPVILMVHEPDFANDIIAHPRGRLVDLMLAGHTHGGQIRIPGLRPLALPPKGRIYPEGHFHVGNSQLYVNRGIGTVGVPFRFNCPPEITVATLRPVDKLTGQV